MIVDTAGSPSSVIVNQPNGHLLMPYDEAKRFFDLDISDKAGSLLDVLALLGAEVAPTPSLPESLTLALSFMEAARWRSSDGELIHDPESGVTFLIDAMTNPDAFLASLGNSVETIDTPDPSVVDVITTPDLTTDSAIVADDPTDMTPSEGTTA